MSGRFPTPPPPSDRRYWHPERRETAWRPARWARDPRTGMLLDRRTGKYVDPVTKRPMDPQPGTGEVPS